MTKFYIIAFVVLLLLIWPIELAVLYSHISSYKKYWTKQNEQPAQPNQLLYVALGDSTAQGIGASTPKNSYPYLVKEWLQTQTGRTVKLLNYSVSGAKVADTIKTQLPQIKNLKPDVLTIEIGANDMKTYDADTFAKQMNELIAQLPKSAYVSDVPAFTGRAKNLNKNVIDANKHVHDIVQTADLNQVNLYDVTKNNKNLRDFAADYFHPSNQAYKNWTRAFTDAMSTRFSK